MVDDHGRTIRGREDTKAMDTKRILANFEGIKGQRDILRFVLWWVF